MADEFATNAEIMESAGGRAAAGVLLGVLMVAGAPAALADALLPDTVDLCKTHVEAMTDLNQGLTQHSHGGVYADINATINPGVDGHILVWARDEDGECRWKYRLSQDMADVFKPVFQGMVTSDCLYKNPSVIQAPLDGWHTDMIMSHFPVPFPKFQQVQTSWSDPGFSATASYQSGQLVLTICNTLEVNWPPGFDGQLTLVPWALDRLTP